MSRIELLKLLLIFLDQTAIWPLNCLGLCQVTVPGPLVFVGIYEPLDNKNLSVPGLETVVLADGLDSVVNFTFPLEFLVIFRASQKSLLRSNCLTGRGGFAYDWMCTCLWVKQAHVCLFS